MSSKGQHPTLTFASLNVNGLRDRGKRLALFSGLRGRVDGVDVLMLQETHHGSLQQVGDWVHEGSGAGRPWKGWAAWSTGTSASRGVAVLVGDHVPVHDWKVVHDSVDGRVIVVTFTAYGQHFRVASVYGPCVPGERLPFFRVTLPAAIPPVEVEGVFSVVGGDWNCVGNVSLDQSSGGDGRAVGYMGGMSEWEEDVGLADSFRLLHPTDRVYTHFSGIAQSAARLDRVLVAVEFAHNVTEAGMSGSWPGDHVAALLTVNFPDAPLRGPGAWMFPRRLLCEEGFVVALRRAMSGWLSDRLRPGVESPGRRWEVFKALVASFTRDHCQREAFHRRSRAWKGGLGDGDLPGDVDRWRARQTAFATTSREEASIAGAVWEDFGETPNGYFYGLGKERRADTTIVGLAPGVPQVVGEGVTSLDLSVMGDVRSARAVLAGYFDGDQEGGMFALRQTDFEAQQRLLASLDLRLSASDVEVCEGCSAGVSVSELEGALGTCASGKQPGCDGLPYEFYRVFWAEVGSVLCDALNESFVGDGVLPGSMREGRIVLVYKGKGSRELIQHYRPLTLLNADYKILAKALARRFAGPLTTVIDPTQTAFIPGRWIGDNVLFHLEEVDYLEESGGEGCVLLLDFQQAYDRVDREWVFAVMRAMGFGERALRWVRLLLRDTCARVLFNGWSSNQFAVRSGVAQGSPLSPVMYVIAAQPLASYMRLMQRRGIIAPIKLPDGSVAPPTFQHADDTTLHVASITDARVALQEGVMVFCAASAGKVNIGKTSALLLGSLQQPEGECLDEAMGVKVVAQGEAVKHLGIMLGRGQVGVEERAARFRQMRGLVAGRVRAWGALRLSAEGRAMVARQLMASVLVYHATFSLPEDGVLSGMESMLMRFVAGGDGKMRPQRAISQLPWVVGGRSVVSLSAAVQAQQAGIIVRLMSPQPQLWKVLLSWRFGLFGGGQSGGSAAKLGYGARVLLTGAVGRVIWGNGRCRAACYAQAFRSLNPYRVLPPESLSVDRQLIEPLFYNPSVVCPQGNMLLPMGFPRCVASCVVRVADLVAMRGRETECEVLRGELRRLEAALPLQWRAASGGWPVGASAADGWWMDPSSADTTVVHCPGMDTQRVFMVGPGRRLVKVDVASPAFLGLCRCVVVESGTAQGQHQELFLVGLAVSVEGAAVGVATLDPSEWCVAGAPLMASTSRQRTRYAVDMRARAVAPDIYKGGPIRPAVWVDEGGGGGLPALEARWLAATEAGSAGAAGCTHRDGGEEDAWLPAWMRSGNQPRLHPAERAALGRAAAAAAVASSSGQHSRDCWGRRWEELNRGAPSAAAAVPPDTIPWRGVWKHLRGIPVPRDFLFTTWSLLHAALPCGAWLNYSRLRSGGSRRNGRGARMEAAAVDGGSGAGDGFGDGSGVGEGDSSLLGSDGSNTLSHTFISGPIAVSVWGWVCQLWMRVAGGTAPPLSARVLIAGDRGGWFAAGVELGVLWDIIRVAAIHFMWVGREEGRSPMSARGVAASLVAFLRRRIAEDVMRVVDWRRLRQLVGVSHMRERPVLDRDVFVHRWCRGGLLCVGVGDSFQIRLTTSSPVPIP